MSANELPRVCDYHGRDNEPCYGKIEEFLDGDRWVTFCEGHQAVPFNGAYIPKDPVRRIIFSQQNQKIRELQKENDMLWEMVKLADRKLLKQEQGYEIEIPAERLNTLEALYD